MACKKQGHCFWIFWCSVANCFVRAVVTVYNKLSTKWNSVVYTVLKNNDMWSKRSSVHMYSCKGTNPNTGISKGINNIWNGNKSPQTRTDFEPLQINRVSDQNLNTPSWQTGRWESETWKLLKFCYIKKVDEGSKLINSFDKTKVSKFPTIFIFTHHLHP